jgi:hypothetical protein
MVLRKFILTIFLVVSLNLTFQPVPAISPGKNIIVLVQEKREDDFTNDFIKENEKKRFEKMIAIKLAVFMIDSMVCFDNSS